MMKKMRVLKMRVLKMCVLLMVMAVSGLAAQTRYALVIGNNAYRGLPPLNNPVNDAADVAAALRELGYNVDLKTNLAVAAMDDAIDGFFARLRTSEATEGFFWFAGHGLSLNGRQRLLAVDADISTDRRIERGSCEVDGLIERFRGIRNRSNLIVIDACRNVPVPGSRTALSRGLSVVSAGEIGVRGNKLIYSTMQGKTAADGGAGKRNSPFAEAFLASIKKPDTFENIFITIADDTLRLTGGEQEPYALGYFSVPNYALNTAAVAYTPPVQAPPPVAYTPPVAVPAPPAARGILPKDLGEVFGVKGVADTFNAVHAFLQTCAGGSASERRARIAQRIMLGDWIDLPRLTVQGDGGGGAINTGNTDLGGNGKLLRLIVVGIDSFAATNKDAPAHIVFQFQNIPGTRRMNAANTNAGGYKASGMRHYLTGNFLRGLVAAGVPEGVLYAPARYLANGGRDASAADALADWLWLPTERELFGKNAYSSAKWETAANQARLEYYESGSRRTKYDADGDNWYWWAASPYSGSTGYFCFVYSSGADTQKNLCVHTGKSV